jgi:hypothetical protein
MTPGGEGWFLLCSGSGFTPGGEIATPGSVAWPRTDSGEALPGDYPPCARHTDEADCVGLLFFREDGENVELVRIVGGVAWPA